MPDLTLSTCTCTYNIGHFGFSNTPTYFNHNVHLILYILIYISLTSCSPHVHRIFGFSNTPLKEHMHWLTQSMTQLQEQFVGICRVIEFSVWLRWRFDGLTPFSGRIENRSKFLSSTHIWVGSLWLAGGVKICTSNLVDLSTQMQQVVIHTHTHTHTVLGYSSLLTTLVIVTELLKV